MRPTIDEQLSGTCRVLEAVVGPAVREPYAADVLRGLVSNLRMLSTALSDLPRFLAWDNESTAALLLAVVAEVPDDLAEEIRSVLAYPAIDPLDWSALSEHDEVLRGLLARVVQVDDLAPEHLATIRRHLAARSSRTPIRFAIPTPKASEGGG
jgi:hypothetical protein